MQLSCDRNLPCHRCTRSGRPEECSFEAATAQGVLSTNSASQDPAHWDSDEIRDLRAEVALLRGLLAVSHPQHANRRVGDDIGDVAEQGQTSPLNEIPHTDQGPVDVVHHKKVLDPKQRSPSGYYKQHILLKFFIEVNYSFMYFPGRSYSLLIRFHAFSHSSKKLRMSGSSPSDSI